MRERDSEMVAEEEQAKKKMKMEEIKQEILPVDNEKMKMEEIEQEILPVDNENPKSDGKAHGRRVEAPKWPKGYRPPLKHRIEGPKWDVGEPFKYSKKGFELAKESCKGDWRLFYTEDGGLRKDATVCDPPPPPVPDIEESFRKQRLQLATNGLKYFNDKINKGIEYELVEPLTSTAVPGRHLYVHGNFLAKPKDASPDASPQLFFAEMSALNPQPVRNCCILNPDPRDSYGSTKQSIKHIYHPEDVDCSWCNTPKSAGSEYV